MNIDEYKNKVINLFSSGKVTKEQWQEMAEAILSASENDLALHIDMYVLPADEYRQQYIKDERW